MAVVAAIRSPYWIVAVLLTPFRESIAAQRVRAALAAGKLLMLPPLVGAVQCFASNITTLIRYLVRIVLFIAMLRFTMGENIVTYKVAP